MDTPWRIELLGWLRAVSGDRTVARFRTRQTGFLLAYLAYFPHRSHPRDSLIGCLWPEDAPDTGRHKLRQALSSLRRQLEPPGITPGSVLLASRSVIQLNPTACTTDVAEFEAALRAARRATGAREQIAHLCAAVERYQGELLPGCPAPWALPERHRLAESCLQTLDRLVTLLEGEREIDEALRWARRAVCIDPLREEAHRSVIRLLAGAGRHRAALEQYYELEHLLAKELGATPDEQTRALRLVLEANCPPSPERPKGRPSRRRPQPDRPPAPSSEPCSRDSDVLRSHPLPLQLTRFFGREREIAALLELLGSRDAEDSERARLVTLTGPGGSGKTRLAVEVAARLQQTGLRAVWFVPLVDLADPHRIADRVRDALGLPRDPGLEPLEQVAAALSADTGGGAPLLLLDNLEHLLDAGARLVQMLLERVADLSVIVTSRQRLDLPGEREFPLAPLPVPDASAAQSPALDALIHCPSVQLYVDRAQRVRPDFQLTSGNAASIAALCARLEGIPLSLELAAARAWVLTPAQMLDRLSQRLEVLTSRSRESDLRHRSLRATLDWSYQLLSPELQQLFTRLSVFRGGWTLQAAEAVCEEPRALDHLEQLRACSLILAEEMPDQSAMRRTVRPGEAHPSIPEMRFRMLETLREYGRDQLEPQEQEALTGRHAVYYVGLAEEAEENLRGRSMGAWLDQLELEHDNLRAALASTLDSANREPGCQSEVVGLRLAGALYGFWLKRGHLAEGRQWVEQALSVGSQLSVPARVKALYAAFALAYFSGDHAVAHPFVVEALALAQTVGDRWWVAFSLFGLGLEALELQSDPERTMALAQESLSVAREVGDPWLIAQPLLILGGAANRLGDDEGEMRFLEELLDLCRGLTDEWLLGIALVNLGRATHRRGSQERARGLFSEGLVLAHRLGDTRGIAWHLDGLAAVAAAQGQARRAARLLGAADELLDAIRSIRTLSSQRGYDLTVAAARTVLGETDFAAAWAEGRALPLEQAVADGLETAYSPAPAADRP